MSTASSTFLVAPNSRKGAAIAAAVLVAITVAALIVANGIRSTSATHASVSSPSLATGVVDRGGVPEAVRLYLAPTTYKPTSVTHKPSSVAASANGRAGNVDDPDAPDPQVHRWLALSR
jgi:hypothetical protein